MFLVSGSPEEREIEVGDILPEPLPQIFLCSTQYHEDVTNTFDYFFRKGYEVFVQWLNPGHIDPNAYDDELSLQDFMLKKRQRYRFETDILIQRLVSEKSANSFLGELHIATSYALNFQKVNFT